MSTRPYIIVNDSTGRIVQHGIAIQREDGTWVQDVPDGCSIRLNEWDAQAGVHFWTSEGPREMARLEDKIALDRNTIDLEVGGGVRFSGIPKGTTVTAYGAGPRTSVVVNDGVLDYDTDVPGTHLFSFDHPLHVAWHDVAVEVA